MGLSSELCFLTAVELRGLVRRRDVSVTEVVAAHLDRIGQVNPTLNAIVSLVDDRAREIAGTQDALLAKGTDPGPLACNPQRRSAARSHPRPLPASAQRSGS